jgi:uncharacterized coiled-coil DUF342 family protein
VPDDLAAIRERQARLEERVDTLRQLAEGVKMAAEQTIRNAERIENLRDDLNGMASHVREDVDRAVKGCEDLGTDLRQLSTELALMRRDQTVMQTEQAQQKRAWTRRETWLLLLAGAFATGAVTLLVNYVQHT